jgi:cell division transport system permease protein
MQEGRKKRRRISYLPSIISISMVLFMLGLFGVLLINGNNLSNHIKEHFQLTVFFRLDAPEADITRVHKQLEVSDFTKQAIFVSKEEAAKEFTKELGQDFVSFLGFNPLLPSVELFVKSAFATPDKIALIEQEIRRNPEVQDVVYQRSIINEVNENTKLIGYLLIALSIIFLLIAVTLINNTIRLNLYARRFIIKSMQMVGATHWFIIRPFALKSLLHGLYGGVLACMMLSGLLYLLPFWIRGIETLYSNTQFAFLYIVLIIAGVSISMVSSMFSTNHYLKLKIDDLY